MADHQSNFKTWASDIKQICIELDMPLLYTDKKEIDLAKCEKEYYYVMAENEWKPKLKHIKHLNIFWGIRLCEMVTE